MTRVRDKLTMLLPSTRSSAHFLLTRTRPDLTEQAQSAESHGSLRSQVWHISAVVPVSRQPVAPRPAFPRLLDFGIGSSTDRHGRIVNSMLGSDLQVSHGLPSLRLTMKRLLRKCETILPQIHRCHAPRAQPDSYLHHASCNLEGAVASEKPIWVLRFGP